MEKQLLGFFAAFAIFLRELCGKKAFKAFNRKDR
jgi:hypothetical protein